MIFFKSLTKKRIEKTQTQNRLISGNKRQKYCYIGSATPEIPTIMEKIIMKMKLVLSTLLGVAAWSLSSMAMAWDTGPCPGGSSAPCIEVVENGNTYHINGSGQHAGVWYGLPSTGADFTFQGSNTALGCSFLNLNCTLTLGGKVQKCQDSSGNWRLGIQVNSSNVSGSFPCGSVVLAGFPWVANEDTGLPHCPFTDSCDNFIPYVQGATSYTANIGSIDISAIGFTLATQEHVHGVVFNPGVGANFEFLNKNLYDCDENAGCSLDGILTLSNATSIDVH